MSDRTRTRWGRRKPWLLGGIVALLIGLAPVSVSTNMVTLTIAWMICQLASNAASAALMASFADNVPEAQRGRASSALALAQNVSILAGSYGAVLLVENLPILFIGTAVSGWLSNRAAPPQDLRPRLDTRWGSAVAATTTRRRSGARASSPPSGAAVIIPIRGVR